MKREFFEFFLRAVDAKHDLQRQPHSWNAGYVVTSKIRLFLDYLKAVLLGEVEVSSSNSSLDPPRLTEAALSSVASMFRGAIALSLPDDSGELLDALRRLAISCRLRGRIIEAIAKIEDEERVLKTLEGLSEDSGLLEDQAVTEYLAAAFVDVSRRVSVRTAARSRCLRAIERMGLELEKQNQQRAEVEIDLTILRALERRREELDQNGEVREVSVAELSQGLSLHPWGQMNQFSDWVKFEWYCGWLGRKWSEVKPLDRVAVVKLLGRGLWHDHVRCQVKAARSLGEIDSPLARGILLYVLNFEENDQVESAIFDALSAQIDRSKSEGFFLALKRSIAERWRRVSTRSQRREDTTRLIEQFGLGDHNAFVSEGCIEVEELSPDVGWKWVENDAPFELQLPWLNEEESTRDVGPELEEKVKIVGVGKPQRGLAKEIFCGQASWKIPTRAHLAINERLVPIQRKTRREIVASGESAEEYEQRVEAQVEGASELYRLWEGGFENRPHHPSYLAIHAVVVTADEMVLASKRSAKAIHSPETWSISFEEQVQKSDLVTDDLLKEVVTRGMVEEFGLSVRPSMLELMSAKLCMEWPDLNPVVVVAMRFLITEDALETPRPDLAEVSKCRFFSVADIATKMNRDPRGFCSIESGEDVFHPTSAARLALVIESEG